MRLLRFTLLVSLLTPAGCETSDRTLSTAERMLSSTTGRAAVDIAQGKDPKQLMKEHADAYQRNPEALTRDLRVVQRDVQAVMDALTGKVRQTWGEKEIKVPERKRDVKYPRHNIKLGTAYLNVLSYNQFESIENSVSREYGVISAYKTGPRNVFRAFSTDSGAAINRINRLQPPAVYKRLKSHLPYQETRDHLTKVVTFRRQFVSAPDNKNQDRPGSRP